MWNESLRLEGDLPENGGHNSVTFRLASLPAMFGLKGLALAARYKEKDAYDLYAMARYFGSGIDDVIGRLKPHVKDAGPTWVANFFSTAPEAEQARIVQDAFATMDRVLKGCGL